ncbi:2-hydroxyacid dehydrogenase [Sinirhodobacter populi]|uniref:2-hydroxyacid dehydrogenase n=1 Tax=Paenirhodobacter populi TaxID=2306993 RepID=A0A443K4M9_9RHOB|nr:NAD(P)-dependent oxidoreductase [Sinirhodobacter populi]RWR27692.1 2-hydroxyacid dehydrogenase [Sinirhodobacter populi]
MAEGIAVALDAADYVAHLSDEFPGLQVWQPGSWPQEAPASARAGIAVFVTDGFYGLSGEEMDLLPALRLIACVGTGVENVDLAAARARGIAISYGAGANAETVADHAMALLLAVVRAIPENDRNLRAGQWRDNRLFGSVHGRRLGVLGFGGIGQAVARRAQGFGMTIGYFARNPRPDTTLSARHFADVLTLAAESDIVVAALPGGPATRHLVDSAFLRALGPGGYLVNVGRGSVVDTQALAAALRDGGIAGAGLDVFEEEPGLPGVLRDLPGLVVSPHIGGASRAARQLSYERLTDNIRAALTGAALVTPYPLAETAPLLRDGARR